MTSCSAARERHARRRRCRRPSIRPGWRRPHDLEPRRRHRPRRRRDGLDAVEVNGGNGAEEFTATANGSRVRFDRVNPAPFAIDVGTSERLALTANGGDDTFSASGNLSALIAVTVDGGAGIDTIRGTNGADVLLGGDGNDFIDGNQGDDIASLGAGDDTFQWDPGDGNDTIEGQDGTDTMLFNGANINEKMNVSANGQRSGSFATSPTSRWTSTTSSPSWPRPSAAPTILS
jgi:Ca2+-binding RTX toxin-like protein